MSVDAFRKFIAKYGVFIFAIMFVAFAVSSFNKSMGCGKMSDQTESADQGPAIATIGAFKATGLQVDAIANANGSPDMGPAQIAQAYASSTMNVINHLFGLQIAADHGITLDDQAALDTQWAQQVSNFRQQLLQTGKIKPEATQEEFEAAFKADPSVSNGLSLEEQKERWTAEFTTVFNDPSKRELVRSEAASYALQEKYALVNVPTNVEVTNSFGTYKVLRLNVLKKPGVDAAGIAQKALADIKGGMKFEDAIKKYSNDTAIKGKSLTDQQDVGQFQLQYFFATYRPLLSMKEGDVSGVIDVNDFGSSEYSIFKIIKFVPNVPPNFETMKGQTFRMMQGSAVAAQLQKEMDAIKASGKLQWKSDAFHAMFDFANLPAETAQRNSALKAVQAEAKKALDSDPDNVRVAALAYYASTQGIYDASTPAQQKAMSADRISALERILQAFDFPDTRLDLADLYLEANRVKDAVSQVELAARSFNGSSSSALSTYEDVLAKVDKLKAKNDLPADKEKSINDALVLWRKTMITEQNIRLASLKDQEDQKKKFDAEMAKKAAEDAKKAAAAKAAAAKQPKSSAAAPKAGTSPITPAGTKPKGK